MDLDVAASRLAALGNPSRLCRLPLRTGSAALAGQVQDRLGIPASTLAHHCRARVRVGLIRQERVGTSLVCRTNHPVTPGLLDDLAAECRADDRSARS